jgi:Zinc carboxypeptidase/Immune inhibitor A peptidase M6
MRRSHRPVVALAAAALLGTAALVSAPAAAATPFPPSDVELEVYEGKVDAAGVEELRSLGLDAQDFVTEPAPDGGADVEVVLSPDQAAKLADAGVDLDVTQVDGVAASEALALQASAGWDAFRPYSSIGGGIKDELYAAAGQYDDITEIVNVGQSVLGEDILALRVTQNADRVRDGRRPAVMYLGTQHAREWITTEMVRRLMHHVLDSYGTDEQITNLVDTRELWFLPVANPDGYDFTFTEGNRLWRKNLRDNDGDGEITFRDGVDLNRNFATNWGYDNEGSSPDPVSDTYRGPAPNSEPETQALDALFARVGFEFFVNYHSAAELLLYGIGHQVTTPSPDDVIYKALAGDDDNTAIPGYDPDISAELYTTNGDTDTHMQVQYGVLGFTPEMTTCEVAAAVDPDDEWLPEDCASEFIFPDDEELIQQEFEKNIPFAISIAESADDPDDPDSVLGIDAPDLVADPFPVSYGTEQQVAVIGKRSLRNIRAEYSINGARSRTASVQEWQGGERYGDTHDVWYAEYRATIQANPGDTVEVRFIGRDRGAQASSESFTYTVHDDIGGDVLVFAMEDVTGLSPVQGLTEAQYADEHVSALDAAGHTTDVYDFDVMGREAPHHLGVLSHYDAVVWETGDDVIPRAQGQVPGTVTREQLEAELNVRDYLNEGGKLLVAGKYALFAQAQAPAYEYMPLEEVPEPGEPPAPECTNPDEQPCLGLSNDFLQYWLGTYVNVSDGGTHPDTGEPYPLVGVAGTAFEGWTGDLNADGSAQNQDHTGLLLTTSSFLPADQFPLFASRAVVEFAIPGGPFDPRTGEWYVYSQQADESYKRLSRTVDMTAATTGELSFWTSYDTELDWDYLFVEARPVGTDDWTTLPDANGHTAQGTGDSCPEGWAHGDEAIHPFLAHYQGEDCSPTGTTGDWHAATGSSQGWVEWSVDLSAYAGQQVEVSISYVSDWATQGIGVFLDDVTVTLDGTAETTGFETDLGGWTVAGPPEGSIDNSNDWLRTQLGFEEGAVVVTDDTVYAGFGLEGLPPAERNDFVARAMDYLLGSPTP